MAENYVKVVDAEELSEVLDKKGYPFTPERLESLAKSRVIPHVLVDSKHLRFFKTETMRAVISKYAEELDAIEPYKPVPVFTRNPRLIEKEAIPLQLRGLLPLLNEVNHHTIRGVYFLCHAAEVVYVGSSENIYARLPTHAHDKKWERVFYLPVGIFMIEIEAAFITLIQPKYNKNLPCKSVKAKGKTQLKFGEDGDYISPEAVLIQTLGSNPLEQEK